VRGLLQLIGISTLSSVALISCDSSSVRGPLRTELQLSSRVAVPGQQIKGTFVIINPSNPINLTEVAHPFGEQAPDHCRPDFQVYLTNGAVDNESGFAMNCLGEPFVIAHGTTRLPFTLRTDYSGCSTTGTPTPDSPMCPASGFPPLPPGSYKAIVVWSDVVPLPSPKPLAIELLMARDRV